MKYTTETNSSPAPRAAVHDFERQSLQILRRTAQAMANSLGDLRLEAGSRPWLQGLSAGLDKSC